MKEFWAAEIRPYEPTYSAQQRSKLPIGFFFFLIKDRITKNLIFALYTFYTLPL
jgi:hypothetical protein